MRAAILTVLFLAAPAAAADPPPSPGKVRAEVAAALALAGSCDCPRDQPARCDEVADTLARVALEIDRERAGLATAPAPRLKAAPCDCAGAKCVECGPSCACAPTTAALPPAAPVATAAPSCQWVRTWDARRGWVWVQSCR